MTNTLTKTEQLIKALRNGPLSVSKAVDAFGASVLHGKQGRRLRDAGVIKIVLDRKDKDKRRRLVRLGPTSYRKYAKSVKEARTAHGTRLGTTLRQAWLDANGGWSNPFEGRAIAHLESLGYTVTPPRKRR